MKKIILIFLYLLALLYLLKEVNKILIWGYGEIGKHAGLKNQCRKASRFDSGYPYQPSQIKVDDVNMDIIKNGFLYVITVLEM